MEPKSAFPTESAMAETVSDERTRSEVEVLEKFGLRWSILAAWHEELSKRQVDVGRELTRKLEEVRGKLSAGCFSSCEIGCEMGEIEGVLVSKDGESPAPSVDFWLELLGGAMSENPPSEEILRYPPVRFHYLNCGFLPCRCKSFEG